jgi:hypothetical protein
VVAKCHGVLLRVDRRKYHCLRRPSVSAEDEDGFVLAVYLDQNKWIDLACAETGHPDGANFVETLAGLKQAVDEGRARFPLSPHTSRCPTATWW